MSHYSWTKESRTLDKKLNGKKTSKIKKFYWERDVFKSSKAKKAIIYKENDFGFFSEIKNLTFQYPKYQLGFFWISRIRCEYINIYISDIENYNIVTTNLVKNSIGVNRANLSNFLNNECVNIYVTWYRLYNFLLGGRDADIIDLNYKKEWDILFKNQIISGDYS